MLGLPEATNRIVTGFNRPNLTLEVKYTADTETKFRALNELLQSTLQGSSIIYTGIRRDIEEVAEFVHIVCNLPSRTLPRRAFPRRSPPLAWIALTCAKLSIYSVPGSLEAYYQEAGCAGWDRHPARAVLLYDPQDRALQEFFIQNSVVTSAKSAIVRDNFKMR